MQEEHQSSSKKRKQVWDEVEEVEECKQCHRLDTDLLIECKRCHSSNYCLGCITISKWYPEACPVCCDQKKPEGDQDTTPVEDQRNEEILWKGNAIVQAAREMLQAVEHCHPETFIMQKVEIRSTEYWHDNLEGLHMFLKAFLETSTVSLTKDQIASLEKDLDDFERVGFNLSWVRQRLDMVMHLKFGNDPLKLELVEANARLEKARLEYESAKDDRNKKADEMQVMQQRLGAEYDDVLADNLGNVMDKETTSRRTGGESLQVHDFDKEVTPKVNEVASKHLKVRHELFKKSSSQIHTVKGKRTTSRRTCSKSLKVYDYDEEDQPQVKQRKFSTSAMKNKQICSSSNSKNFNKIYLRSSPRNISKAMQSLSKVQKEKIKEMGFGSLLEMSCSAIPGMLGYFVVDNFDPESMSLKLKNGDIHITPELIKQIFGIPNGGTPLLSLPTKDSTKACYVNWHSQFVKEMRPLDLAKKIHESKDDDMIFVLNFIMLFLNTFDECTIMGCCKLDLLERFDEDVDIKTIDWCGYIYDCLKTCKMNWKKNVPAGFYYFGGPITVLMLIYLGRTQFKELETPTNVRAIKFWTGEMMKQRERLEIHHGAFGHCEVRSLSEKAVAREQSDSEQVGMVNAEEQSPEHPCYNKDMENRLYDVVVKLGKGALNIDEKPKE